MKLFQKLLLAPAALGLFAPMAVNANESNFRDVTSYSQDQVDVSLDTFKPLSSKNPLLAGGEGQNITSSNEFDVDSFSATTTANFTSNFAIGKQEGGSTDPVIVNFDYEIALSSSFNGSDSLDVVLNAGKSKGYTELDMTDSLSVTVDSISYALPLGERVNVSAAFGGGAAGSSLYNTACVYGAQADTFSKCGVSAANIDEGLGVALGANFDIGAGFTAALAYEGQGTTTGLMSYGSTDAIGGQIAYTGDSFGISLSYANIENHDANNVVQNCDNIGIIDCSGLGYTTQSLGINAYFSPDLSNFPTISAGFETNHDEYVLASSADETSHYFIGLQWDEIFDGTLGAAVGSKEPYNETADALTMYEVFYSYEYADGITLTPIIYSKDNSGSTADETGVILKSTFSF